MKCLNISKRLYSRVFEAVAGGTGGHCVFDEQSSDRHLDVVLGVRSRRISLGSGACL